MPMTPGQKSDKGREIRIALVMNGGVSLAVWMGGVTHELDLLRRASNDMPYLRRADKKAYRLWKKETEGVRVKIDIISGTSAGGLNGLLLATAISRGGALPDLRKMWRQSASLKELKPNRQELSVLSGLNLTRHISKALDGIRSKPKLSDNPVTLFVTATALDGPPRVFKDGFGEKFEVRDHRRLYCFKNQHAEIYSQRPNGEWGFLGFQHGDFHDGDALVRAARATASFPGAFEPVSEEPILPFRKRPALHDDWAYPRANCVMDGGVLNNAPFDPVLEEITKRRIESGVAVDRFLVYIVPSSGRLAEEKIKNDQCSASSPIVAAWNALHYPKEADFRTGTEDLEQRLRTSFRDTREDLFSRMFEVGESLEGPMRKAACKLLEEYRRSRVKAVVLEVLNYPEDAEIATTLQVSPRRELHDMPTILSTEYIWFPPAEDSALLSPFLGRWRWGIIPAERILQTLYGHLDELLKDNRLTLSQKTQAAFTDAAARIYNQVVKVIALHEAARTEEKTRQPNGVMSEKSAAYLIQDVFNDLDIPEQVAGLVRSAAESYLKAMRESPNPPHWSGAEDVISALLVGEVLTKALAPPAKVLDKLTPEFKFMRLGPDVMGPLFQADWDLGDQKLYGVRYRHFGAFISEDWRRSDFAWGRLDAAHHLLRLLRSDTEDQETLGSETRLHKAILSAEKLRGTTRGDSASGMRANLNQLARSKDDELLRPHTKALKPLGGDMIRLMMRRRNPALRALCITLWHMPSPFRKRFMLKILKNISSRQ
ncbi:DUF3376 domain-containing protein [Streptomyces sp. NPDC021218]|uniref:DUF3376 domain-containing protein n=1 Tax=Streptomyces sp. NPDC021218 TaxID=3365119 RepID=UPI0037A2EAA8